MIKGPERRPPRRGAASRELVDLNRLQVDNAPSSVYRADNCVEIFNLFGGMASGMEDFFWW